MKLLLRPHSPGAGGDRSVAPGTTRGHASPPLPLEVLLRGRPPGLGACLTEVGRRGGRPGGQHLRLRRGEGPLAMAAALRWAGGRSAGPPSPGPRSHCVGSDPTCPVLLRAPRVLAQARGPHRPPQVAGPCLAAALWSLRGGGQSPPAARAGPALRPPAGLRLPTEGLEQETGLQGPAAISDHQRLPGLRPHGRSQGGHQGQPALVGSHLEAPLQGQGGPCQTQASAALSH